MFRTVVPVFIALVIAIGGGAWSLRYALEHGLGMETLTVGPWQANPDIGTPDASPYARAVVARRGELPLGRAEGLTFHALNDSSGAALERNCSYSIAGELPPARFWTLHAADPAMRPLPAVGLRPAALQSTAMLHDGGDSVLVTASPHPTPANWLALSGTGRMILVLALYDTPIASSTEISRIVLPRISRLGCE
ncbi:MAG: DUF1214 domain-containing protein [Hyphomicrobiales bacterium]|nr:DUF1214 domain-containing protein [Hyphomicrobiales bacterium]